MASGLAPDVTRLLLSWSQGNQAALDELMPLVYGELRRLASAYLRRERSNHTLQSTALVHEAFMRLVNQQEVQWRNRAHFFAIAAQMIRRILVGYARAQHTEKRGSGSVKLELDEAMAAPLESGFRLRLGPLGSKRRVGPAFAPRCEAKPDRGTPIFRRPLHRRDG